MESYVRKFRVLAEYHVPMLIARDGANIPDLRFKSDERISRLVFSSLLQFFTIINSLLKCVYSLYDKFSNFPLLDFMGVWFF